MSNYTVANEFTLCGKIKKPQTLPQEDWEKKTTSKCFEKCPKTSLMVRSGRRANPEQQLAVWAPPQKSPETKRLIMQGDKIIKSGTLIAFRGSPSLYVQDRKRWKNGVPQVKKGDKRKSLLERPSSFNGKILLQFPTNVLPCSSDTQLPVMEHLEVTVSFRKELPFTEHLLHATHIIIKTTLWILSNITSTSQMKKQRPGEVCFLPEASEL